PKDPCHAGCMPRRPPACVCDNPSHRSARELLLRLRRRGHDLRLDRRSSCMFRPRVPPLARGLASANLYRAIWRWHFYAGICVLPFVLVLALSGLAMLASEPLDRYLHAELLYVAPAGTPLPASAQVAAVAQAYPDAAIVTLT